MIAAMQRNNGVGSMANVGFQIVRNPAAVFRVGGLLSVLAIAAFVVLPGASLVLLGLDGYYFPLQHYVLNVAIMWAFAGSALLSCVFGLCDAVENGWRKTRVWEGIVLQSWRGLAVGGATLGSLLYGLGVCGVWRSAIEEYDATRMHFVGLVLAAAAVSLYAVMGRAYLWAMVLQRKEMAWASWWVTMSIFVVWVFSFCFSEIKAYDLIGWCTGGITEGVACGC